MELRPLMKGSNGKKKERIMKKLLLILSAMLLMQAAAVSVSAQDRLQSGDTITGVVRVFNDGSSLFAVYVTEIDSSSAVKSWASTDVDGRFSFVLVNPGDSIKFSFYRKEKSVLPIDRKNFEIRLEDDKDLPPTSWEDYETLDSREFRDGKEIKGSGIPIPLREAAKDVKTIDMSQFEDLGLYTIDEVLNAKIR